MSLNEDILDDYAVKEEVPRFVRRVLIVVGILLTVLGGLFFLGLIFDFYRMYQVMNSGYNFGFLNWETWLLNKSLSAVYTISFLVGGIGLLRRKVTGWVFGLASAIFGILNIAFIVFRFAGELEANFESFGWIMFGVAAFFSTITFFLLTRRVRSYFSPNKKAYLLFGIVFAVFVIDFMAILIILG